MLDAIGDEIRKVLTLSSTHVRKTTPARIAVIAIASCTAMAPVLAQPTCGTSAGFSLPDRGQQRPVRLVGGALVFTSGLRVNTDGAPNSYHPLGTSSGALNTLCNGIAVIPHSGPFAGRRITALEPAALSGRERCRMILDTFSKSRAAGFAVLPDADIEWFAIAARPPADGKYRPCVQQSGPFAGFFVAQTSRAADSSRDICDPAHWISSTDVPYVTLPGNRLRAAGVTPGDLALVHRRVGTTDHIVAAVAADTGNANELGEGSVALHAALGNPSTARLPGNIAGGVTTVLFPRRRATEPITAATLDQARPALLTAVGGERIVIGCGTGG